MTDQRQVEATTTNKEETAMLSLSCWRKPGDAPVAWFVTSTEFLGSSRSARGRAKREIMFRIDDSPAEILRWYYSDHSAVDFTGTGVSEFGNILRNGSKLMVRMFTYRGHQVDATFDVSGASEMIDKVKLLCRK